MQKLFWLAVAAIAVFSALAIGVILVATAPAPPGPATAAITATAAEPEPIVLEPTLPASMPAPAAPEAAKAPSPPEVARSEEGLVGAPIVPLPEGPADRARALDAVRTQRRGRMIEWLNRRADRAAPGRAATE